MEFSWRRDTGPGVCREKQGFRFHGVADLAKTSKGVKKGSKKPFSFEQSMERIEKIVTDLESGELSLEESLEVFEEGVGLVKSCRGYLESARQRVEILLGRDEDGNPEIDVFAEDVDEDYEEEDE